MQHYWSLHDIHLPKVWLTIGSFDGVHIGHQAIVRRVIVGARKDKSMAVVLTFHPHPATILRNRIGAFYLTTPQEQAKFLGELGVDVVVTQPFNQTVANTSAKDFIEQINQHLRIKHLCIGHDFTLGRNREGNARVLRAFGDEFGFSLTTIEPVILEGQVVSSSRIRSALQAGDLVQVNRMLGRPYQVNGEVISGDKRGRTMGIPTANLEIWQEKALPKPGVYACLVDVDGVPVPAVTNIGVRPTFNNPSEIPRLETHLIEFNRNLYGRQIAISFIAFLRDEIRFEHIELLKSQILEDIQKTKVLLARESG